jgi:hypothetical protein
LFLKELERVEAGDEGGNGEGGYEGVGTRQDGFGVW